MQNMPDSLKRIIEKSPNLEHRVRGLPNLGENLIDGQFSKEVSKIYDAFGLYGNEFYDCDCVQEGGNSLDFSLIKKRGEV